MTTTADVYAHYISGRVGLEVGEARTRLIEEASEEFDTWLAEQKHELWPPATTA